MAEIGLHPPTKVRVDPFLVARGNLAHGVVPDRGAFLVVSDRRLLFSDSHIDKPLLAGNRHLVRLSGGPQHRGID